MELPLKVLNRLRLGRDVAARVAASQPDHLAWVYVDPILNEEPGLALWEPGPEGRTFGTGIRGFLVRYLEAEARAVEEVYQGVGDEIIKPVLDEQLIVSSEEALATTLSRWLTDFTTLHIPKDVGYRFEQGPQLLLPRRNKYPF